MPLADPENLWDFSDVWSSAIDGSGTGIWDRNVVTNEIRYSRSWFAILGYDDVPPSNHIEIAYTRVHPEDLAYVKASIQAHFDQKTDIYEVEHRLCCKDGSYKWVLSRGKVINRNDAGRPLRMVGTTTDITAIRELSEKLKLQHAKMREDAVRLAAVTQALAERSEELASAHRLAQVGGWRWDLANRWLWLSPEAWKVMGRAPANEPVTCEQMRAIYHPDDYTRAIATYCDAVRSKSPVTLEYRIVHPDGTIRDILTHAEPVADADGHVSMLRGTSQDITPYRRIEAALRESEDHYRHMVELHPEIPWTAGPDGEVLEVGPKWLKMTGMPKEAAMPPGGIDAVCADDRDRVLAAWKDSLSTGERLDIEYRLRLSDGRYRWVRARAAARRDGNEKIIRWYGTLDDVTKRYTAEEARRASEALALRVLETTGDAVIVFDRNGCVRFSNSKVIATIGNSFSLVGLSVDRIFQEMHTRQIREGIHTAIKTGDSAHFEIFWPSIDRWFEVHIYASTNDVSLFLRDISDKKIAQEQLNYAARHDFLTGALNRGALFASLTDVLAAQTPNNLAALFCLDLDGFKDVNDTLGHPVGDTLLKLIVGRLQSCLGSQDLLARNGGDEFMILQAGIRQPADAVALATRIVRAMQPRFDIGELSLSSRLSIGVALSAPSQTDPGVLYKQADLALYDAKIRARGSYRLFQPEMQTEFDGLRQYRIDLTTALATDQFLLEFQPIMRIPDQTIVDVEALLRWRHPERGLISPAEFIPIAEENNLILEIGAWVLRRACATARSWPEHVKVSVNVSPRQFELNDICSVVTDALRVAGLPPSRLKLEVTESLLLSKSETNLRALKNLRDLGVALVLDDFGTGYSSLSYLDTFRFDSLKIDRSFLFKIRSAGDKHPIFEAIMGMATAMDIPVTAEGVETNVQLAYIERLRCNYAQGRLFAAPMAENELLALLSGQQRKVA